MYYFSVVSFGFFVSPVRVQPLLASQGNRLPNKKLTWSLTNWAQFIKPSEISVTEPSGHHKWSAAIKLNQKPPTGGLMSRSELIGAILLQNKNSVDQSDGDSFPPHFRITRFAERDTLLDNQRQIAITIAQKRSGYFILERNSSRRRQRPRLVSIHCDVNDDQMDFEHQLFCVDSRKKFNWFSVCWLTMAVESTVFRSVDIRWWGNQWRFTFSNRIWHLAPSSPPARVDDFLALMQPFVICFLFKSFVSFFSREIICSLVFGMDFSSQFSSFSLWFLFVMLFIRQSFRCHSADSWNSILLKMPDGYFYANEICCVMHFKSPVNFASSRVHAGGRILQRERKRETKWRQGY